MPTRVLIFLLLNTSFCFGQYPAKPNPNAPVITLEKDTVDYGTIPHNSDGVRILKFTNRGKEPLIIYDCKGSGVGICSCSREPVGPGKTGEIKVHYSTDRIGKFCKGFTISSNATPNSYKNFYIKGNVLPPDPNICKITFDNRDYNFGEVPYNTEPALKIKFTNAGNKTYVIKGDIDEGLEIVIPKDSIHPGESGEIIVKDTLKRPYKFQSTLYLRTNICSEYESVHISGYNLPDPDRPIMKLENNAVNLGYIKTTGNGWYDGSIRYSNVGKKDLVIKDIHNMHYILTDTLLLSNYLKPLPAGKTAEIKFRYKASFDKVGWFHEYFNIFTNGQDENLGATYITGCVLPDSSKAVLTFQQDTIDFGKPERGKKYTRILTFKNTGKDTLRIYDIKDAACYGYAGISDVNKEPILPGQVSNVTITFSTSNTYSGMCKLSVQSNASPSIKEIWIEWQ